MHVESTLQTEPSLQKALPDSGWQHGCLLSPQGLQTLSTHMRPSPQLSTAPEGATSQQRSPIEPHGGGSGLSQRPVLSLQSSE